jgi:Fur family transcriptional regulator, ferric uptake regulator
MATVSKGRRTTRPRRDIADLIREHNGCFTAAELLAEADSRHVRVGRATVFRTLDLLAEQGALERIDLPTGEHAYVACEPEQHHHHVVCRNCGRSVEVADAGLQAVVRQIGAQSGFLIESHRLELYGLCPECAA